MGDRDDPDDVMETSLTIDYDKQWLNCVSAIGPRSLAKKMDELRYIISGLHSRIITLITSETWAHNDITDIWSLKALAMIYIDGTEDQREVVWLCM